MKLYFIPGVFSLAIRIIIYELGIVCEFEAVDKKTKKTESGDNFLEINIKGQVPALLLDNKELLTENAIILQYLADQHGAFDLLPKVGDFKRYRVLEWLNYITTDLHKGGCVPLFNPNIPQDVKDNVFKPLLLRKLDFIETHLSQHNYLWEEKFTLSDAYLYTLVRCFPFMNLDTSVIPKLISYKERLEERCSIKQSIIDEGLISRLGFHISC